MTREGHNPVKATDDNPPHYQGEDHYPNLDPRIAVDRHLHILANKAQGALAKEVLKKET